MSDSSLKAFKEAHRDSYRVRVEYYEVYHEISMPGVKLELQKDGVREYSVEKAEASVNEILKCISDAFLIKDISIKETEIEEIVRKLYESV